jgi:TM2 domain-containing membrane protein YozV
MPAFCSRCGSQADASAQFCRNCGTQLATQSFSQPGYAYVNPPPMELQSMGADKKLSAGICGIVLGSLGIHKFILGYRNEGLIMLLATVLTCGLAGIITGTVGLVEEIIYLTKTDGDFVRTYIQNKRPWF